MNDVSSCATSISPPSSDGVSALKALLVNTATVAGVIGVAQDGEILAEVQLALTTASNKVISAIDEAILESRCRLHDMDAILLTKGPGTFTGTRVGVSIAKGIAYALPCSLASISTLEAVAWAGIHALDSVCEYESVWALLDARRNEFYAQRFVYHDGILQSQAQGICGGSIVLDAVLHSRGLAACAFSPELLTGLNLHDWPEVAWQFDAHPTCRSMIAAGIHALGEDPLSLEPVYLRTTEELFDRPRSLG